MPYKNNQKPKTKTKLEDSQRKMTSYLQRNKDKNYNILLIRNHASQTKMKWHFKVLTKKKNTPKKQSIRYTKQNK